MDGGVGGDKDCDVETFRSRTRWKDCIPGMARVNGKIRLCANDCRR